MKVAIIGAGAAGMMAAATINELSSDIEVFLVEKNDALGKKVIISGGGRCNVTTGFENVKSVLENYPRGNKFLISAINRFPPLAVRAWFETHGVPLKCEKDMRVFPVSNNGQDIVGVFKQIFDKTNTKILFKHAANKIEKVDRRFLISFKDQDSLMVDKVVLALGGQAYRMTGSTGDGYTLAESLGHTVTKLAPSLHSFLTVEKWPKALSGVSFLKATITADCAKPNSRTGPFLFTHTGISGPAVFAVSSLAAFTPFGPNNPLKIFIDFVPDKNTDQLSKDLLDLTKISPKKNFKNTLHEFIPAHLVDILCNEFKLPGDKKNAEISKMDIFQSATLLKKVTLHAIGRGAGDEFVTAGGVELSEVNPKTMESKICPGLYLAGEILNVDGFTGGYNLQASWAAGFVAGESIAGV